MPIAQPLLASRFADSGEARGRSEPIEIAAERSAPDARPTSRAVPERQTLRNDRREADEDASFTHPIPPRSFVPARNTPPDLPADAERDSVLDPARIVEQRPIAPRRDRDTDPAPVVLEQPEHSIIPQSERRSDALRAMPHATAPAVRIDANDAVIAERSTAPASELTSVAQHVVSDVQENVTDPFRPATAVAPNLDVSRRVEITPELRVSARPPRETQATSAAPQVNISIGRVEVHAAPPRADPVRAEPSRPATQRRAPVSLDEYLRRRERPA
jgi:hypothetical protein